MRFHTEHCGTCRWFNWKMAWILSLYLTVTCWDKLVWWRCTKHTNVIWNNSAMIMMTITTSTTTILVLFTTEQHFTAGFPYKHDPWSCYLINKWRILVRRPLLGPEITSHSLPFHVSHRVYFSIYQSTNHLSFFHRKETNSNPKHLRKSYILDVFCEGTPAAQYWS